MTAPIFQPPGQPARASAKRDRATPGTATGECPHCGGTNIPMRGRDLDRHHEQRVKGRKLGLPVVRLATEAALCPGSLHPAVPGTVTKTKTKPHLGRAMPAGRRDNILNREGAA